MKKRAIILIVLLVLIVLFGRSLFKTEEFIWTDLVDGKKSIILAHVPGIRLISETRGESSYQANYIDEESKDTDLSKKINKLVKKSFCRQGWEFKGKKTEGKYQISDFQTKDEKKNETIKMVIGFENGRGTLFSFDYHWPLHSKQ